MKHLYTLILTIALALGTMAQTPQGFNYQGVARTNNGTELANQAIALQIAILNGSATGTVSYSETHQLTTDANGLFSLTIGLGTATTGTFSAIDWASGGSKWLKISLDAAGGSNYQLMGTTQLLSVPYALFAGNVTNNGGKQTLVLSDNVTDAEAAQIIATEVGPNTQEILIAGTTQLTTVNLSMIKTAISISIENNSALTSVNLSGLTRCDGEFGVFECPNLSTLNLSALSKMTRGGLYIKNTALTSINLPTLTTLNGSLNIEDNTKLTAINMPNTIILKGLNIYDNNLLNSISFTSLTKSNLVIESCSSLSSISFPTLTNGRVQFNNCTILPSITFPALINGGVQINNCANLSSISFSSLTDAPYFYIANNASLSSVSFPALKTIGTLNSGDISIWNNPTLSTLSLPALTSINANTSFNSNGLTSISLPSLTNFTGSNFYASSNKLSSASVNALLSKFVSISGLTGKYIELGNQNPPAPPTGQGLTDKQTLIDNGNNVWTD